MEADKIVSLIYEVIDETNEGRAPGEQLEKTENTVLFGREGRLKSLEIVHFIVAVEDRLRDDLGVSVTLADERAMSRKNSPFRSVAALAAYIGELLQEQTA